MRTFLGVDPGLKSGGAAIVDTDGRALVLAGWLDGRLHVVSPRGPTVFNLLPYESGADYIAGLWTGARWAAAIEQPLTVGAGRHADTWRSLGHWEQVARATCPTVHLVPYRTWVKAADIAGSDGVAEVRRRVRELTAHLDPQLPGGRGGWPAAARDAAREAYLIARWCAVGAS